MQKIAQSTLILLFVATILFHILVLAQIIDYKLVWGGRMNTVTEMYIFESISLFLNILFLIVVLIKTNKIKIGINKKVINTTLFLMLIVFVLNTVGNLISKNSYEKLIFTPLTFLSAIFIFIVMNVKEDK